MSDIVERLRREWDRADGIVDRKTCLDAADLIECQAKEIERLHGLIAFAVRNGVLNEHQEPQSDDPAKS